MIDLRIYNVLVYVMYMNSLISSGEFICLQVFFLNIMKVIHIVNIKIANIYMLYVYRNFLLIEMRRSYNP